MMDQGYRRQVFIEAQDYIVTTYSYSIYCNFVCAIFRKSDSHINNSDAVSASKTLPRPGARLRYIWYFFVRYSVSLAL